jgi:hypothetical protein
VIVAAIVLVLGRDLLRLLKPEALELLNHSLSPAGTAASGVTGATGGTGAKAASAQLVVSPHERECGRLAGSVGKVDVPRFHVTGTVMAEGASMALISEGEAAPDQVKIGEYLPGTCWRLKRVAADSVTLWYPASDDSRSHAGKTITVKVAEE